MEWAMETMSTGKVASPGLYARAWMEGRMDEQRMEHFRQEAFSVGLSSYPIPFDA